MKKIILIIAFGLLSLEIQAQELISKWSFDQFQEALVHEDTAAKTDRLIGFFDPVSGIKGKAVRFDGYTSFLEREKFPSHLSPFVAGKELFKKSIHQIFSSC